jgi:oxygen-independent coproporphyrinogen-3 oxidase
MEDYVGAVVNEIQQKAESRKQKGDETQNPFQILKKDTKDRVVYIDTIYFGGGTPTLLPINLIEKIWAAVFENFNVNPNAEITIEANPEQCSIEYLSELIRIGFNRISIGIQSFDDDILNFLGRTHTGNTAFFAIENAQKAGFENISVDLIYGIYLRSLQDWKKELKLVFKLPVKHLSAYSLTVEENTLLHKKISQQISPNVDENQSLQELKLLMEEAEKNDFEHYEVSNFAIKGYHSIHNSNYWNGTHYLGFGASAHSFTGKIRSWNVSNVDKYFKAVEKKEFFCDMEQLTSDNQYNEYVLLRLRTKEGIYINNLEQLFGIEKRNCFLKSLQRIDSQFYYNQSGRISITKEGLPLLDNITANFF